MTLARFMNYILYTDKRPENISGARWCAMMTQAASMRPQPQKQKRSQEMIEYFANRDMTPGWRKGYK